MAHAPRDPRIGASRSARDDDLTRTILLVEHEVLIRMPLAEYLRQCGFRVFEASNAAEARAVLNADTPVNLVFAEVNLPDNDSGFMLASWIRQQHPNTAVLLTSSVPDAAAKAGQLCNDLGLVPKPYEHVSILLRIQTLLRQARTMSEAKPVDE